MSDCGLISGPASQFTIDGLDQIRDYANQAIFGVEDTVDQLGDLIEGLNPLDVDIDLESAGSLSTAFDIDDPTYFTVPQFVEQTISYNPTIGSPDFSSTVTHPGAFTGVAPELDFPDRPDPVSAEAPTGVPEVGTYAFPDAPSTAIPAVPNLRPIVIPDLPSLTLPTFDAPDPGIAPTEYGFADFTWTEAGYTPTVRSDVVTQLQAILGGSTGIPDAIWDMIEIRMRRQLRATARQATEQAVDEWASRGHFLTTGQLRKRTKEAIDVEREGVSDAVRELAIQDARIYVERLNTALAEGISLENQLIGLYNAQQDRALQAARTIFEIRLDVARYKIEYYNASLTAYQTKAQVFQTLMQGELARLEETRLELEAQKLVGELNQQSLESYKSQITAIVALYDVYTKQVDAVTQKYEADKTRVEAFAETVKVYEAQVDANKTEWSGYAEAVRAELARLETYKVESDVYLARINAYRTGVEADKISYDALVEKEKLKIDWMGKQLDKFEAEVRQETARIESILKTNETNARQYEASGRVEASRVESDSQRLNVLSQNANFRMQAQLRETELKITEARNKIQAQTDALQAILAANSQVAASALAALNYSASISDSVSNSTSCSVNYQY